MPPKKKGHKGAGQVPEVRVEPGTGSASLVVNLQSGQSILASPGSLIYLRGNVQKGDVALKGLGRAFLRSLGGEDFFLNTYTGAGEVCFSSDIPGDIIAIPLAEGESYLLSQGCFLAATPNITLSAGARWRGLLGIGQDEGFLLPKAECPKGTGPGVLWLAGYGSFKRHDLAAGERLIVDNGIFLACPSSVSYTLETLGRTMISTVFGGEGFGMQFVGPATVYTQSKNLGDFLALTRSVTTQIQVDSDTVQKVVGWFGGPKESTAGGGRRAKRPSKKQT
jgi:uncharacterized protein (TIGR00266 family)